MMSLGIDGVPSRRRMGAAVAVLSADKQMIMGMDMDMLAHMGWIDAWMTWHCGDWFGLDAAGGLGLLTPDRRLTHDIRYDI